MRIKLSAHRLISIALCAAMAAPAAIAQDAPSNSAAPNSTPVTSSPAASTPGSSAAPAGQSAKPPIPKEEIEALIAPIALYPDNLLSQILMASTYPLEVVQASRWATQNKSLPADTLAQNLEKQPWDPSVKSLVNFPQVLDMMDKKLDWTVKLGDAFIGQQKEVMDAVQTLGAKAKEQGNLESNAQQTVTVQPATSSSSSNTEVIVIQPADPEVIYVPTYSPTVVYGSWGYPAYPPYYYTPPGYAVGPGVAFGVGLAIGVAWGYAWGGCDWGHSDVDIDVNRNTNINTKIDRDKYKNQMNRNDKGMQNGKGNFRHDPSHRDGIPYRDNKTAQQFGRGSSDQAQRARDSFRGQPDTGMGRQPPANTGRVNPRPAQPDKPAAGNRPNNAPNRPNQTPNRPNQGTDRPNQGADRQPANNRQNQPNRQPSNNGTRNGAFDDVGRGNDTRNNSDRGKSSRSGSPGGGGARPAPSGGARGGGRGGGGARGGRR